MFTQQWTESTPARQQKGSLKVRKMNRVGSTGELPTPLSFQPASDMLRKRECGFRAIAYLSFEIVKRLSISYIDLFRFCKPLNSAFK